MNKKQLTDLKKNIKHYTPEIIVGVCVIAGVAAAVAIRKDIKSWPTDIDPVVDFGATREQIETLRADSSLSILYQTGFGDFKLKYVPGT